MNIVYSSSDSFSEIAGISILSLFETNRDADRIDVYIIDNGITRENKDRLLHLAGKFGRTIVFLPFIDIEKAANVPINVGRWHISTFYRLFLCTILPGTVNRLIYLDCDTLVVQPLGELWRTDMGEAWVCGVDDCRSGSYRTDLGLSEKEFYINNGVLLVDLKKWRGNRVERQFIEFIRSHQGDITYVDQGVLNAVLGARHLTGLLHPRYNALTIFFDFTYENLMRIRKPSFCYDRDKYLEAVGNPAIVHFQSCFRSGTRPWNPGNRHPYTKEYLRYKACSPWKDTPLRADDRTFLQKALTALAKVLPQTVMVRMISLLHTRVYPMLRSSKKRLTT